MSTSNDKLADMYLQKAPYQQEVQLEIWEDLRMKEEEVGFESKPVYDLYLESYHYSKD
jgi:hypothetical protein